jgi:hypothetical protein
MDIQIIELENKLLKEQIKLLLEMNNFLKEIIREKSKQCSAPVRILNEETKARLKRLAEI